MLFSLTEAFVTFQSKCSQQKTYENHPCSLTDNKLLNRETDSTLVTNEKHILPVLQRLSGYKFFGFVFK